MANGRGGGKRRRGPALGTQTVRHLQLLDHVLEMHVFCTPEEDRPCAIPHCQSHADRQHATATSPSCMCALRDGAEETFLERSCGAHHICWAARPPPRCDKSSLLTRRHFVGVEPPPSPKSCASDRCSVPGSKSRTVFLPSWVVRRGRLPCRDRAARYHRSDERRRIRRRIGLWARVAADMLHQQSPGSTPSLPNSRALAPRSRHLALRESPIC